MSIGPFETSPAYTPGLGDSELGHFTVPGSGLSFPGGLECVFQYRGLLMNVQGVPDRYRITSIDGLMDADIRDVRDQNTNSDGETPYNSFYGGRTLVLNGTILTYSIPKLRDMTMALRTAFSDVTTEYPLIFRTGTFANDHMIFCKKISAINMTEQQQSQDIRRDFQVSVRASYPCFVGYYQKTIQGAGSTSGDLGSYIGNAVNLGNYRALPTFRAYGPSTSTTITNDTNGQSFTLGPIGLGDYLEFGMGGPPLFSKYLIDSYGVPAWDRLDDASQYIEFEGISTDGTSNGDNLIWCQNSGAEIEMWWRDTAV